MQAGTGGVLYLVALNLGLHVHGKGAAHGGVQLEGASELHYYSK